MDQSDLAESSGASLPTIKRLEKMEGTVSGQIRTVQAIIDALKSAGVEFIPENGGGAGVRLRK